MNEAGREDGRMAEKPKASKVTIERVNFWWYLVPVVPIVALAWLALAGIIPSWGLLIALFAGFFWLFSLLFTLYAVWRRRNRVPPT
jgi:hypothetical protein